MNLRKNLDTTGFAFIRNVISILFANEFKNLNEFIDRIVFKGDIFTKSRRQSRIRINELFHQFRIPCHDDD